MTQPSAEVIADRAYEVLSIRTGDKFMKYSKGGVSNDFIGDDLKKRLFPLNRKQNYSFRHLITTLTPGCPGGLVFPIIRL